MGFLNSHQYSAVTSIINDCCKQHDPSDDEDYYIDSQLSSLLEAIKNQKDYIEPGPVEAARALRKKMKYGNVDEQINALKILDLLVVNSGRSKYMKPLFDDDKLLDRLQYYLIGGADRSSVAAPLGAASEKKLKKITLGMMSAWHDEFSDVENLNNINLLFERCMRKRESTRHTPRGVRTRARLNNEVPDFMNDEADMDTPFDQYDDDDDQGASYSAQQRQNRPKTNAELDKKFKIPKINYEKEAPKILQLIAEANIMATNLLNILNSLEKDELSIHSIRANDAFDQCRAIRRKLLRYLQLVQREELLGPLLKCNDELVVALKKYEEKSVPPGTKIYNDNDDSTESDEDSLANYESEDEPRAAPAMRNSRSNVQPYSDSEDDGDSYYSRDRYVTEDPPNRSNGTSRTSTSISTFDSRLRKAPPPVPPKNSILRTAKVNNQPSQQKRPTRSDYDPFSDDNEVAPTSWS